MCDLYAMPTNNGNPEIRPESEIHSMPNGNADLPDLPLDVAALMCEFLPDEDCVRLGMTSKGLRALTQEMLDRTYESRLDRATGHRIGQFRARTRRDVRVIRHVTAPE